MSILALASVFISLWMPRGVYSISVRIMLTNVSVAVLRVGRFLQ